MHAFCCISTLIHSFIKCLLTPWGCLVLVSRSPQSRGGRQEGSSDKHHDGESRGPLKTGLGRGVDQIEIGKEEVTFLTQKKANSKACNVLVCVKHRNPLISWSPILSHGKGWYPGLGQWLSTEPESPRFSRAAAVPSTRCLSFSGVVEGLFLLSTDSSSPNPPKRHCSMKAVLFGVGPPTERGGILQGPCIPCRKQCSRTLTLDFAFWSLKGCSFTTMETWGLCVSLNEKPLLQRLQDCTPRERAERHVGPGIGKGNNFMDTSLSGLPYQVRCCFLECRDKMSCIEEGPVIQYNLGFQRCAANEVTAMQGDQWMCVDKVVGSCWSSL